MLDIGAGAGLVGVAVTVAGIGPVDGLDISGDIRAMALGRRDAIAKLADADPAAPPPPSLHGPYGTAVISTTFTHGHRGREVLPPLAAAVGRGAVFAFSVNSGVWNACGFPAAFATTSALIEGLAVTTEPVGAVRNGNHGTDTLRLQARWLR